MIIFKSITARNFLSYGNVPTTIRLDQSKNTLVIGTNGCGKCVDKKTNIDIQFSDKETEELFLKFLSES
jgi:hypothetical protein